MADFTIAMPGSTSDFSSRATYGTAPHATAPQGHQPPHMASQMDSLYHGGVSGNTAAQQQPQSNLVSNAGSLLLNGFRRGSAGGGHQNFSNSGRLESGVLGDYGLSPSSSQPQQHSFAMPPPPAAQSQQQAQQRPNNDLIFWNSPPMPAFQGHGHSQSHSGAFNTPFPPSYAAHTSSNNNINARQTGHMPPPPPLQQTLRRGASFTNANTMPLDSPALTPTNDPRGSRSGYIESSAFSALVPAQQLSRTPLNVSIPSSPHKGVAPTSPIPPYSPAMTLSHPSSPAISNSNMMSSKHEGSQYNGGSHPSSPSQSRPHPPSQAQSQRPIQLSPSLMPPVSQSAQARMQKSPAVAQQPLFYSHSPNLSPYASSSSASSKGPAPSHMISQPSPYDLARTSTSTSSHYFTPRLNSGASPHAGPSTSPTTSPSVSQHSSWPMTQPQTPRKHVFRKFRHRSELKPIRNSAPAERRADPQGGFISPLRALTTHLLHTYNVVNPAFRYETSHNPRRVLTKPSVKAGNDGHDNEDADYILYVNDWLGSEEGNKYLILDILGQGTFGQVVKCQNMKTHEIVAVKVVKNKPAYFNQSMMEVTILDLLNNTWDPKDEHHILRLKDQFIHCRHLCLVFELLSSNLYDLIKQNSFRGLSLSLVRVFTAQLLDCLTVLNEARLIHCDLKPENILLKTLQSPTIKVIDFGSACHERQTVYTYIQSRFYRSPEVLLGLPYSSTIDMWSLGCICVELFLGLPLFPGTSEYNQLSRIVEMLGPPPSYMLEVGKQAAQFFEPAIDNFGVKSYRLKPMHQYSQERGVDEQPSKRYFAAITLPEIVYTYPMARKEAKASDVQKEMNTRSSFIDFVSGLLNLNPMERWSPQQAKMHPFILGIPLTEPYKPSLSVSKAASKTSVQVTKPASGQQTQAQPATSQSQQQQQSPSDTRRKYGGLQTGPPQAQARTYNDAAAYNRHLSQQQAYTAMHQAKQNRAAQMSTNPYAAEPAMLPSNAAAYTNTSSLPMHNNTLRTGDMSSSGGPTNLPQAYTHPGRGRSMTLVDAVPPQMQRIGLDLAAAGKSMTPVLRREDQALAWERRQKGGDLGRKASMNRSHHPALDLLTQQAELGYRPGGGMTLYPQPAAGPSNYGSQYAPFTVVVEGQQQQQQQQRRDTAQSMGLLSSDLSTPPAALTNSHRYTASTSAQPFDMSLDQYDGGMGLMYAPMHPANVGASGQQQLQQTSQDQMYWRPG